MLVVVAIIAVIAGIAFAAVGAVRKMSDRAKCLTNLRTVGGAMASYVSEHEGYLPGPLWRWQSCWYNANDSGSIGTALAPYLNVSPDSESRRLELLVCPAWQRGAPYRNDESFHMNFEVDVDGNKINPWGDGDLEDESDGADPDDPAVPKLLTRFSNANPSRIWVMQDLDALSVPDGDPRRIAPKPVHGDKRNALFLDFHAESVPLDHKP